MFWVVPPPPHRWESGSTAFFSLVLIILWTLNSGSFRLSQPHLSPGIPSTAIPLGLQPPTSFFTFSLYFFFYRFFGSLPLQKSPFTASRWSPMASWASSQRRGCGFRLQRVEPSVLSRVISTSLTPSVPFASPTHFGRRNAPQKRKS